MILSAIFWIQIVSALSFEDDFIVDNEYCLRAGNGDLSCFKYIGNGGKGKTAIGIMEIEYNGEKFALKLEDWKEPDFNIETPSSSENYKKGIGMEAKVYLELKLSGYYNSGSSSSGFARMLSYGILLGSDHKPVTVQKKGEFRFVAGIIITLLERVLPAELNIDKAKIVYNSLSSSLAILRNIGYYYQDIKRLNMMVDGSKYYLVDLGSSVPYDKFDGATPTKDISATYGSSYALKSDGTKVNASDQLEMTLYLMMELLSGKQVWWVEVKNKVQSHYKSKGTTFDIWSRHLFKAMSVFHDLLMRNPGLLFDGYSEYKYEFTTDHGQIVQQVFESLKEDASLNLKTEISKYDEAWLIEIVYELQQNRKKTNPDSK